MAVTDFLSGGTIPSGSSAEDLTTTASLPDWYTNYGQQLIANQQALSAQGYNPATNTQVAGFTPAQQAAFGQTATGATSFVPGLQQAGQTTANTLDQSASAAAQPYIADAAQTAPSTISNYLNPYNTAVTQAIGQQGANTISQQVIPQIQDAMVAAGQFGGSRQAQLFGQGIAQAMQNISAQQASALQSGYSSSTAADQADLARQAGLATTAGNLASTDVSNQLAAAGQQASQAQQLQNQTLAGAGALNTIGTQQQTLDQSNLNAGQTNAQAQQTYLQNQINAGLNTLSGVKAATPTSTTAAGIVPSNYTPYGTSTAAQVAGGLTAGAGLLTAAGNLSSTPLGSALGLGS